MSKKLNLAIIFGGKSAEHDISIRSANNIIKQIDLKRYQPVFIYIDQQGSWFVNKNPQKYINKSEDLSPAGFDQAVFLCLDSSGRLYNIVESSYILIDIAHPVLHGPFGEDGAIQGLLKTANIPYVGPDVLGSAIGMDKVIMKRILRDAGIKIGPFLSFLKEDTRPSFEHINEMLSMPVFVKPANMGSSIGINKVNNQEQLRYAMEDAFKYDRKIIIEANIVGREIECAVLGNEHPVASILGEVLVHDEFYAYDTKYLSEEGATVQIPADLSDEILRKTQKIAISTFKVLACEGLGRVDVFLQEDGTVVVNEINTLPGFTSVSMFPMLWESSGLTYTMLLNKLYELAINRHERV